MIVAVGVSHHTASIEVREKIALDKEQSKQLVTSLVDEPHIAEAFIVSTCNRLEIFAVAVKDDPFHHAAAAQACRDSLLTRSASAGPSIYTHTGTNAVRHLIRVASSLDSLVVGEAQILGQLKEGFEIARTVGAVGTRLHQLFSVATRGAKRVRTETTIGMGQVSVPSIAADLAVQIFGDLKGRRAVLIGAGEMGQAVARLLRASGAQLSVVGRTEHRVAALAEKFQAEAHPLAALSEVLVDADIVVSSTSAPHPILTPAHLEQRKRRRGEKNLFLIDLAVPRDIDADVGKIDGVFLYDIDDLSGVANQSSEIRGAAAKEAEGIVEGLVRDFERRSQAEQVTPMIKALRAKMRLALEEELGRSLRGRLKDLGDEERTALAKMLDSGLSRILHDPVTRLRDAAGRGAGTEGERASAEDYVAALSELFDLPDVGEDELDVSSVRLPSKGIEGTAPPPSTPREVRS